MFQSVDLRQVNELKKLTTIPANAICQLTELCLRTIYFKFEDQLFEQVDGAVIG